MKRIASCALALSLILPLLCRAQAPSAPPPQSLLHGRYQVLGGGSEVKDAKTGLVWARCSVGQRWDGKSCAGQAKEFTFDKAQKLAGGGWRVPTVRELASLIYCSSGKTEGSVDLEDGDGPIAKKCDANYATPTINSDAFPSTPSRWFWTSSPFAAVSGDGWGVLFSYGYVTSGRKVNGAVRLVRAPQ